MPADDTTRSDPAYLHGIIAAIEAGASTVTVCDSAGTMLPEEFGQFAVYLYLCVPALKDVSLGIYCSDNLAMAHSCTIAAVCQGAGEIKAAAYPLGTASLPNVARIVSARSDALQTTSSIRVAQMSRTISQIAWVCQNDRKKASPFGSGVQQEDKDLSRYLGCPP